MNPKTRQIGIKEISLIHFAKNELGLNDDVYRDIIECITGKRSAKNLTYGEMDKLMAKFKTMGFEYKPLKPSQFNGHKQPYFTAPDRDRDALPSLAQMKQIEDLFHGLGWIEMDRKRGFIHRQIKKFYPQTRAEAIKVIEGLKAIAFRKNKSKEQNN